MTTEKRRSYSESMVFTESDEIERLTRRDPELEQELGRWYEGAYKGETELYVLRSAALGIEEKAEEAGALDSPFANLLLKEAIALAHPMNDSGTRGYYERNSHELKETADRLMGRKEAVFEFELNGRKVKIRYHAHS